MTSPNTNPKDTPKKRCPSGRRGVRDLLKAMGALVVLGLVFWLLWNLAGVPLLAIPPLTYWQALGATVLTGVLVRLGMFAAGGRHGRHPGRLAAAHCSLSGCSGDYEPRDNL